MSAQGVDELLRAAQRQAAQQEQGQQMLEMTLRAALRQPHTVTRHNLHMAAVGIENNTKILMFGLPTGDRLEIVIPPQLVSMLVEGLQAKPDEDRQAA